MSLSHPPRNYILTGKQTEMLMSSELAGRRKVRAAAINMRVRMTDGSERKIEAHRLENSCGPLPGCK